MSADGGKPMVAARAVSEEQRLVAALGKIYPAEPGVRYTADGAGLFVPSPWETALTALQAAAVGKGTRFLDLGSGDGRVVALAAAFGAAAEGIEIDGELHCRARQLAEQVAVVLPHSLMKLQCGDIMETDIADADVVFYYAGGCADRQKALYARLAKTLSPGARLLIMRTQRRPDLDLELSPLAQPPYFYLFTRRAG